MFCFLLFLFIPWLLLQSNLPSWLKFPLSRKLMLPISSCFSRMIGKNDKTAVDE